MTKIFKKIPQLKKIILTKFLMMYTVPQKAKNITKALVIQF